MMSQGLALKTIDDFTLDEEFWAQQRAEMMGATLATWRDLYVSGAQEAAAAGKLPFDLDAINLAADRYVAAFADDWWLKLEATTREGLRQAIATANAEGLGVDYVFQASKPLFGEARALNIAVTETTRVLGGAAQEVMRESGVPEWDWDTAMDAVVCDLCKEKAAGSPYPMTTPFEPRHVGCRCAPSPRMAKR